MENKIGVILMTYGSATTAGAVRAYMEHIYRGKASEEIIHDFENRYALVGGSPLIDITKKQAEFLENELNANGSQKFAVRAGMLHSVPFIHDAIADLKRLGVQKIKGIILSPQFSSFIMDGYSSVLIKAAEESGFSKDDVSIADAWPTEPHFIGLLAARIEEKLSVLEKQYGRSIPVLFTTHSLPQRVVEKDPHYLEELRATIEAVIGKMGNKKFEWHACYQSAGHTPETWLKPDLTDILDILSKKEPSFAKAPAGEEDSAVLIVPIQFLADHLEILYDLDIAGREQCEERGIAYYRIGLPNTDPLFIKALAAIAKA